jgi:hypothetical protein
MLIHILDFDARKKPMNSTDAGRGWQVGFGMGYLPANG